MRRFLIPCLAATLALTAVAQEQPASTADNIAQNQVSPRLLSRIRGLFDVDLPRLDPPGTVKFIFHPHLGGLLHKDYFSITSGARWAINDAWELDAEADAFITHGFRSGTEGYGIGEVRLGGKYVLRDWPEPDLQCSLTLNTQIPTGHPPLDFTDGFNHYTPGIVIQHHSETYKRWTTFGGFAVDFMTKSDVPGLVSDNQPHDDNFVLTGGAIYDLGQIKWTLQTDYITTALIGGVPVHIVSVRPSVLWFVPRKFTFNSKTQWIVGVGARATWGPGGFEFSQGTRVRAEVTFRQVIQKIMPARR